LSSPKTGKWSRRYRQLHSQLVKKVLWAFFAKLLSKLQYAILAAAAGYETGKDTLTVSFPTFLPSEIFGRLPLDAENGAAVTGSSIPSLLPICKTDQPCP
jgi:hypothetical protein